MSNRPYIDPENPGELVVPTRDGKGSYVLELGPMGDPMCLACEALDPDAIRFTEEQAGQIRWLICDEHVDLIHMQLEMTTSHPSIAHIFAEDARA